MKNNTGFTLTEILTAVVIVTILVTMAVPLSEKTIERSRLAEARTIMAKLEDSKLQAMDQMGCLEATAASTRHYTPSVGACPKLRHLGVGFADKFGSYLNNLAFDTDAWHYSIFPQNDGEEMESELPWFHDGVCARRRGGDYQGTVFFYLAPGIKPGVDAKPVGAQFECYGTHCEDYGMSDSSSGAMTITCE